MAMQAHASLRESTARTLIVGAGPIGLELAAVFKRLGHDYLHLDAGQVAHTVSWYPRGATIFSSPERIAIAGVPFKTPQQTRATREQYLQYLHAVIEQFDLKVQTFTLVIDITRDDQGFRLTAQRTIDSKDDAAPQPIPLPGASTLAYRCQNLVLAIGDMHLPNPLGIEGEDLPHVSHYFDDPQVYFRRKLLIVGGKNSAVEAALRCWRAGADVALSYRGDTFDPDSIKYWLLPELQSLIKREKMAFYPHTQPVRITSEHVELQGTQGQPTQRVPADAVLMLTGYRQDARLFDLAGVTRSGKNQAPEFDENTMMTDVPGLYVAGTAAAGTQHDFKLFIENGHRHVGRIAQNITGGKPPAGTVNSVNVAAGHSES